MTRFLVQISGEELRAAVNAIRLATSRSTITFIVNGGAGTLTVMGRSRHVVLAETLNAVCTAGESSFAANIDDVRAALGGRDLVEIVPCESGRVAFGSDGSVATVFRNGDEGMLDDGDWIAVPQEHLCWSGRLPKLEWVGRATAQDETRYAIDSVFVESREGDAYSTLVACDGRRLHTSRIPDKWPDSVFLGRKLVSIAVRTMLRTELPLTMWWWGREGDDARTVMDIRWGDRFRIQVDGLDTEKKFPNWREVVPNDPNVRARFGVEDACAVLDQIEYAASIIGDLGVVALKLRPGQQIAVSAAMRDDPKSRPQFAATMPATVEGEECEVVMNLRYLRDAINADAHQGGEYVLETHIHGAIEAPVKLTAPDGDFAVIMPCKKCW